MKLKVWILIIILCLLSIPFSLFSLDEKSTQSDSLQYFWNHYIRNAVHELNPCNGFDTVKDIPANNMVKFALNEYYRRHGFNKLRSYKENVVIYKIPISELNSICQEYFMNYTIKPDELEEVVYDWNYKLIVFDPRILSFYQKENLHIRYPVLENISPISKNSLNLKVRFYKDPQKKEWIHTITYTLVKTQKNTFVFYKAIYQVNPEQYMQPAEGFNQIILNMDPHFIINLQYLGHCNQQLIFGTRDFLSGIFNFYLVDQKTLKITNQKRFYFKGKKTLYKMSFEGDRIQVIIKDRQYLINPDLKYFTSESYQAPEPNYSLHEIQYSSASGYSQYGELHLNAFLSIMRESSYDRGSSSFGNFVREKGKSVYKKLEIPNYIEDNLFREDISLAYGGQYAFVTSYRYKDRVDQIEYSLNKINLTDLKYEKDLIVSDKLFLPLLDCLDEHTLLFLKTDSEIKKSYYTKLLQF
jgi:hypothetical protein